MGCSSSKLDDEEAVQLCRDRKNFIKQAVEQRIRFATGHIAYIESLKRVSAALGEYVEGDEPLQYLLDSCLTPPFTPVKKTNPGFISISPNSSSKKPIKSNPNSSFRINYLRPSVVNATTVVVEDRPQSPEIARVQAYASMHQFVDDGFFQMQSPPTNSSIFSYPPNDRPNIPPPSPHSSQWDFWSPFSSLDYYGYNHYRSSIDHNVTDDEMRGMRQVREEEGIPDLEEETEQEETYRKRKKFDLNKPREEEEVSVEDLDDEEDEDQDCDFFEDISDRQSENEYEMKELDSHCSTSEEEGITEVKLDKQVDAVKRETSVVDKEAKVETPGFTVYVNRRPANMTEVIKDLQDHFTTICNAANEISPILEPSRAQHSSSSLNELTAMQMLNPVALFRSASSRSTSSRFGMNSSGSKDEGYESSGDFCETPMFSGSHQSTLDRLYAWEKKLYQEVRCGERIRIAYEKKCMQLRNQDVKGDDYSAVDKTRLAIRDLHTQLKVSIHSVEAVSKRIETLRDEELLPQLFDLLQGLARMWKVMAECHQSQKRILDEAKLLLASTTAPSKLFRPTKQHYTVPATEPHRLARSTANLESGLRNWRFCFETWIASQQSYVRALAGWLIRCTRCDSDTSRLPFSPRPSTIALPIFGICIQWSRFLDEIPAIKVLEKLDFFAAGIGSLYAHQQREESQRVPGGSRRFSSGSSGKSRCNNLEVVDTGGDQFDHDDDVGDDISREKMANVAVKVMCAGMSVAVCSLTEFAMDSSDKYADLIRRWENAQQPSNITGKKCIA